MARLSHILGKKTFNPAEPRAARMGNTKYSCASLRIMSKRATPTSTTRFPDLLGNTELYRGFWRKALLHPDGRQLILLKYCLLAGASSLLLEGCPSPLWDQLFLSRALVIQQVDSLLMPPYPHYFCYEVSLLVACSIVWLPVVRIIFKWPLRFLSLDIYALYNPVYIILILWCL